MNTLEWIMGIVATLLTAAVVHVYKTINGLPLMYMPRDQLERAMDRLQQTINRDIAETRTAHSETEARIDRRFDALATQLTRMEDKMDGKADK